MSEGCVFCDIVAARAPASRVYEDAATLAFMDLRQFHPGHVLVIPKHHVADLRDLAEPAGAALMACLLRVTRAVSQAFPSDGMNLWHSIGAAGGQEVFHLHFHVLPRYYGDGLLQVYPSSPVSPPREQLDGWARRIRQALKGEA